MSMNGPGFFSEMLLDGMARQGISAKRVATLAGCSYEHIRKLSRREVLPSPLLLARMCEIFHWNAKRALEFVRLDQARKKFGKHFWVCLGLDPEYEEVYVLWVFLKQDERQMALDLARFYVARRPRHPHDRSVPEKEANRVN